MQSQVCLLALHPFLVFISGILFQAWQGFLRLYLGGSSRNCVLALLRLRQFYVYKPGGLLIPWNEKLFGKSWLWEIEHWTSQGHLSTFPVRRDTHLKSSFGRNFLERIFHSDESCTGIAFWIRENNLLSLRIYFVRSHLENEKGVVLEGFLISLCIIYISELICMYFESHPLWRVLWLGLLILLI